MNLDGGTVIARWPLEKAGWLPKTPLYVTDELFHCCGGKKLRKKKSYMCTYTLTHAYIAQMIPIYKKAMVRLGNFDLQGIAGIVWAFVIFNHFAFQFCDAVGHEAFEHTF